MAIKRVEGGLFSTYANESIKNGDALECMPPSGNFKHIPEPQAEKNYVLFAAGEWYYANSFDIEKHITSRIQKSSRFILW